MTPTHLCLQMNAVYDGLALASPDQLKELHKEATLRYTRDGCPHAARFVAQLWYELERRQRKSPAGLEAQPETGTTP